jgi:hypothetical protein
MSEFRGWFAGMVVALTLLACPSPPAPGQDPAPAPELSPEQVEPAPPVPPVEPPPINIVEPDGSDTHSADTDTQGTSDDAAPAPATEREVIRRRCKPGFSACHGGRECCNDLFEVCARDNHCHPFE